MTTPHHTRSLNTPTIIGLTGPKGCGKDTVADLLRTHARFEKCAFADALRYEICAAFGVEPLLLSYRPTKEEPHKALSLANCKDHGFIGALLYCSALDHEDGTHSEILAAPRSPRQIMQWWGTDYRRQQDDCYWTRQLSQRLNDQVRGGQYRHVITDVRFDNEADRIRDFGGVIWQVKRPDLKVDSTHSSESDGSQFKPDAVINNSHDIRHLQSVVMGAWLMLETGMSAQEVFNMGNAHVEMACAQ